MSPEWVFVAMAVLAVGAGVVIRCRVLRETGRFGSVVTDQDIVEIERRGRLTLDDDEPLDLDRVREAEERFWSETWDEADD